MNDIPRDMKLPSTSRMGAKRRRTEDLGAMVQGIGVSNLFMLAAQVYLFYTLGSNLRFCLESGASVLIADK